MKNLFILIVLAVSTVCDAQSCIGKKTCIITECVDIENGRQKKDRSGYVTFLDDAVILDMSDSQKNTWWIVVGFTSKCTYDQPSDSYYTYGINKNGEQILMTFSVEGRRIVMTYLNKATGKNLLYDLWD
jgi:hypothetical protein